MSIDTHLTSLENKHRAIEHEIAEELSHPATDSVKLQALKRKKLYLKDNISRIRHPKAASGKAANSTAPYSVH